MIKPATLRALAKQAGHAPAKIFKIQPEHLLEMLEENFEGIKEWTEEQAKEKIEEMKSSKADKPAEKVEEAPKAEEKKEEKPKRTRKSTKKKEVEEPSEEVEKSEEKPVRRRRKKSVTPVAKTPNNLLDGQIELLNLKLDTLVKKNEELSATVNTMMQFLAWFHNVQIDPKDPIASLGDIDWNGCIKDQM